MIWFFLGILILIIVGVLLTSNDINKRLKKEGFEMKNFKISGKVLSVIPITDRIIEESSTNFGEERLVIFDTKNAKYLKIGEIEYKDIISYSIEDKSTIQSRVGLKRLLVAGIFAFAIKKKEKLELKYVVIEWKSEGFTNEAVFEFEGNNARFLNIFCNELQNKLVVYRKTHK